MIPNTEKQFLEAIHRCKSLFEAKYHDYGASWRILRPSSLTDQIFIKASRIRNIEEKKTNVVGEPIDNEFVGIINYAIMALIQLRHGEKTIAEDLTTLSAYYDQESNAAKDLLFKKNSDYGEAWRSMRVSSYTDLILMKLLRIKQMEDNNGARKVSEGLDANFLDILNYSVFALIRFQEKSH